MTRAGTTAIASRISSSINSSSSSSSSDRHLFLQDAGTGSARGYYKTYIPVALTRSRAKCMVDVTAIIFIAVVVDVAAANVQRRDASAELLLLRWFRCGGTNCYLRTEDDRR